MQGRFQIGHDHTPTGPIGGFNTFCHRIDHPIRVRGLSDDQIRHALVEGRYHDYLYTAPKSLYEILNEAVLLDMRPMINLNVGWWKRQDASLKDITPQEIARIARILAEYLHLRGFRKNTAEILLFNEPGKTESVTFTIEASNAVHDAIRDLFDLVVGNEEWAQNIWKPSDWNRLASECRAPILGVHPLSSQGTWQNPTAYRYRIRDWKTIANSFGKRIIATEGGSWFRAYNSTEGHKINKEIIMECKSYGYEACNIVLVDINRTAHNNYSKVLGYRIYNHDYSVLETKQATLVEYYNDLLNLVQREGFKMVYDAPEKLKALANYLGIKVGKYEPELPILTGTGFWQNAANHKRNEVLKKADFDASMEQVLKLVLKLLNKGNDFDLNVYYKNDGSWNSNWESIAKSNPKE